MTVINFNQINQRFTNEVLCYINKGYVISTNTMGGTSGECATYVDLVNPADKSYLLRVWKERVRTSSNEYVVLIQINKYTKEDGYEIDRYSALYSDDGAVVNKIKYYEINRQKGIFTDSKEEFEGILCKQNERFTRKYCTQKCTKEINLFNLPHMFIDDIIERIRQVYGCKRANGSCIKSVKMSKDHKNKLYAIVSYKCGNHEGTINLC
jgi:hypothetical protein